MRDQRDEGDPRVLVVAAAASLNTRIAILAADAIERLGPTADLAFMRAFDAPSYDGDLEHPGARVYPGHVVLDQAHNAFDDTGGIADERLRARFDETIANFLDLGEASTHYPCVKRARVEFLGELPDPAVDCVER